MKRVVINTIVFEEQLVQGARQLQFFESLAEVGIKYVEVRQEYFKDAQERIDSSREANRVGIDLLYSVPKDLFQRGQLDSEMIIHAIQEAKQLSAVAIKWTRGDYTGWTDPDLEFIRNIAKEFNGLMTVENDQTLRNGTLIGYKDFLRDSKQQEVQIFSTFDIGNWRWVGEDPLVNARELSPYVKYIHVKDVVALGEGLRATPIGQGELPIADILSVLPSDTLVALEYPCGTRPLETIREGLNWLAELRA